ncbi:hypothetical protein KCU81_g237, partial [Aureobasidium melanogenum]
MFLGNNWCRTNWEGVHFRGSLEMAALPIDHSLENLAFQKDTWMAFHIGVRHNAFEFFVGQAQCKIGALVVQSKEFCANKGVLRVRLCCSVARHDLCETPHLLMSDLTIPFLFWRESPTS